MIRYLTEEEYKDIMLQDPPADFDLCEQEARQLIDSLTVYRLQPGGLSGLPEFSCNQVKRAMAKAIWLITEAGGYKTYTAKQHQKITAEKVGGYSVNYTAGTNAAQRVQQAVIALLWPTGLMYRGICH